MNSREARKILSACRPDSPDVQEGDVKEALAQLARDPQLQEWHEQHLEFQKSVRAGFRRLPVPEDLSQRILAGRKVIPLAGGLRRQVAAWASVAAALALLIVFSALWFQRTPHDSFEVFRSRMIRSVAREYRMDIETADLSRVRQFLSGERAAADFELQGPLAQLELAGAGLLSWQRDRVSMICFRESDQNLLFLFVVNRSAVQQPPPETPEFRAIHRLNTASWSRGDHAYLLAAHAGAPSLEKYFPEAH